MQKLAAAAQSCSIKRVTILNTYSWLNKGDAAIVLGTAHVLREINSDVAITIVSQTPKIDRLRYKEHGIHVVAGPFGLIYEQDTAEVWRLILFIVSFSGLVLGMILTRVLGRSAVGWLPGETGRLAQSITSVDIIIS